MRETRRTASSRKPMARDGGAVVSSATNLAIGLSVHAVPKSELNAGADSWRFQVFRLRKAPLRETVPPAFTYACALSSIAFVSYTLPVRKTPA